MGDKFRRSRRGRGSAPRPGRGARRSHDDDYDDEYDDRFDDEGWDDADEFDDDLDAAEPPRRRRGSGPPPARRPARGKRSRGGPPERGKRSGASRAGSFDWSVADEEEEEFDRSDPEDDYDEPRARRGRSRRPARRGGRRPAKRRRTTLLELCTPVFGYASLLPRSEDGPQPGFEPFRQQVVAAIKGLEEEGERHGIDRADLSEASYALALFIDEEVASSAWTGKSQWSAEPLHITMHGDPEGGINFYNRLEALGSRQKDVRAVYLVCLALGFRGKYIELDATQQVSRIAQIKEEAIRAIHRTPIERRDMLFPEAYRPAAAVEHEVPAPPRWWTVASIGAVVLVVILYVVLFLIADRQPREATQAVSGVNTDLPAATPMQPERPTPADPGPGGGER